MYLSAINICHDSYDSMCGLIKEMLKFLRDVTGKNDHDRLFQIRSMETDTQYD